MSFFFLDLFSIVLLLFFIEFLSYEHSSAFNEFSSFCVGSSFLPLLPTTTIQSLISGWSRYTIAKSSSAQKEAKTRKTDLPHWKNQHTWQMHFFEVMTQEVTVNNQNFPFLHIHLQQAANLCYRFQDIQYVCVYIYSHSPNWHNFALFNEQDCPKRYKETVPFHISAGICEAKRHDCFLQSPKKKRSNLPKFVEKWSTHLHSKKPKQNRNFGAEVHKFLGITAPKNLENAREKKTGQENSKNFVCQKCKNCSSSNTVPTMRSCRTDNQRVPSQPCRMVSTLVVCNYLRVKI